MAEQNMHTQSTRLWQLSTVIFWSLLEKLRFVVAFEGAVLRCVRDFLSSYCSTISIIGVVVSPLPKSGWL